METWFLLFKGSSPDGLGRGTYVGRTLGLTGAATPGA